jgi:DNA-binding Xre family transcriptional regulator
LPRFLLVLFTQASEDEALNTAEYGCLRVNAETVSIKQKEGKKIQNTLEMLLHNREMSYDELAKQCGMTYNGIAKIAKQQNRSIQYASVEKITKTLNITANDLLGYFYSLPQPQIEITDIYQLSEQNHQVYQSWLENREL